MQFVAQKTKKRLLRNSWLQLSQNPHSASDCMQKKLKGNWVELFLLHECYVVFVKREFARFAAVKEQFEVFFGVL